MALVFFAVRRMAKKENLESYLNIFVWLGVLTSLFGLWQFFGDSYGISTKYTFLAGIYIKDLFGFPRIQSTFFEPGFFANFLLIPIFLSVYKYFKSGRPAYLFALFLTSLAFFLTLSRGGLYSLLISLFLLLVLVTVYNRELIKKIIPALLMVVFAFFLSLASIYFVSSNKGLSNYGKQSVKSSDLVVNGGQASKDALSRSYTISVALKNWKENKWGAGTGAFGMLPEFESVRASGNPFQTVNSLYPEILVEQGIQGLIVFLSFLGLIFVFLIKKAAKRDILYLVFACIFSGMFIQYVSFSTLYLVYVWVFLGLAMRMEPKDNV
jgi:O-antigen ligase